jgi:hypothetical protein
MSKLKSNIQAWHSCINWAGSMLISSNTCFVFEVACAMVPWFSSCMSNFLVLVNTVQSKPKLVLPLQDICANNQGVLWIWWSSVLWLWCLLDKNGFADHYNCQMHYCFMCWIIFSPFQMRLSERSQPIWTEFTPTLDESTNKEAGQSSSIPIKSGVISHDGLWVHHFSFKTFYSVNYTYQESETA